MDLFPENIHSNHAEFVSQRALQRELLRHPAAENGRGLEPLASLNSSTIMAAPWGSRKGLLTAFLREVLKCVNGGILWRKGCI